MVKKCTINSKTYKRGANMEITLKHMSILYFSIIVIVPFLLFFKSKIFKLNTYNEGYLAKDNTDVLKGLSVVIIIITHLFLFSANNGIIITFFLKLGYLSVAIFLFVSGYGLMFRFAQKKDEYFKGYFKNKILKLYLIFFSANIVCTLLRNIFFNTKYGITDIIKSSLLMNFSDGRELWFVSAILYFYIAFYIAFKFFDKNVSILIMFICLGIWIIGNKFLHHGTWFYNTAICFPLGNIIAKYNEQIFKIAKKYYLLFLTITGLLFILCAFLYIRGEDIQQFIVPPVFNITMLLLLMKVSLKSRFFRFMNEISFDFYLLQIIILNVVFQTKNEISSVYFLIAFTITVIVSKILNMFVGYLFSIKIKRNLSVKA
jgi:membrane-bound acyltransferase YfiQ involved in biofilm formation